MPGPFLMDLVERSVACRDTDVRRGQVSSRCCTARSRADPAVLSGPSPVGGESGWARRPGLCGQWLVAAGGGEVIARGHLASNHNYMSTQKGEGPSPPEQIRGWLTGRL